MTPAARVAAAIAVLDDILAGEPAERCLSRWARGNRYAGSKDRAAVRDHVFDVLRRKRSLAAIGGAMTGRGLMIGLILRQGSDIESIFGVGGYCPDAVTAQEMAAGRSSFSQAEEHDFPDWLWPIWCQDLGAQASDAAQILQKRGPVTLRVNLRRTSLSQAMAILAEDSIESKPVADMKCALQVTKNNRKILLSQAFENGLVELQDLASQEAVAGLAIQKGARVLDYCAGGGGKALAIADMFDCDVFAHDISTARTSDILPRATRAGVEISVLETSQIAASAPFDAVFVDAPCSGSGTWRRAPEAKWALSVGKLNEFSILQGEVLNCAAGFVAHGGQLIYATCSVFDAENDNVVSAFLAANAGWILVRAHQRVPDITGDGFYHAVLTRR
tara:strand:+ start:2837 stop:4003 length:1167 start_codon:yes stop_codon:yes gene_type:complete